MQRARRCPMEYSSGDVEWLGECHHVIGVSEAHYSGGCRKGSLHDATHLSSDSCLCLIKGHLSIRVERPALSLILLYISATTQPGRVVVYVLGGQHYVPRYLCSPVPMFPEPMFPGTYVPRFLCSPVPMFPGVFLYCK